MANQSGDPRQKHTLKLKGSLGKGAFGQIYKGTFDGDVVAVKTMAVETKGGQGPIPTASPIGPSDSDFNAQMFFREAAMLKECSHRRIIGYRALMRMPSTQKGSTDPMWALVMEYAKHGNLGQRVVQNMIHPGRTSYSNAQALGWALDVAQALEYLHMRCPAVLHRDVKSANIMLADEGGSMVAKLSDFGLHVAADASRPRTLQASSFLPPGMLPRSLNGPAPAAPSLGSNRTPDSSSHTHSSSGASTSQQPLAAAAAAAVEPVPLQQRTNRPPVGPTAASGSCQDVYSEVHDSCGSRAYLSSHSTSGTVPPNPIQRSDSAAAAAQGKAAPKRNNSFRRAIHHPPGEALPRVQQPGAAALGEQLESAADANARLFAVWRGTGSSTGDSMCSMVTEGTWGTQGTAASCTDTAGSDCTDDTCGSVLEEVETVFNMTGRTGSCLYMAPEVYLAHCYNEKSDVFSYGVVLYELFARCLIVFTELPTNSTDPEVPQRYAAKVAEGYRPSRPKAMPDNIWALISACWQQDPLLRPHMSEVVSVLSGALSEELASQLNRRKTRPFGRKAPTSTPAAANQGPLTADHTLEERRRSFQVGGGSQARAEAQLKRLSDSGVVWAPLANITSGVLLSDRTSATVDLEVSTPRSNSSGGRRSMDAKPRAKRGPAAVGSGAGGSNKAEELKKGVEAAPAAAQGCGCVIC